MNNFIFTWVCGELTVSDCTCASSEYGKVRIEPAGLLLLTETCCMTSVTSRPPSLSGLCVSVTHRSSLDYATDTVG